MRELKAYLEDYLGRTSGAGAEAVPHRLCPAAEGNQRPDGAFIRPLEESARG